MSRTKHSFALTEVANELDAESRAVTFLNNLPDNVRIITALRAADVLAKRWVAEKELMVRRNDPRKVYDSTAQERWWLRAALTIYSQHPTWNSCADAPLLGYFADLPPDAAAEVALKVARYVLRHENIQ